jgi:hypothetical protein
MRNFKTRERGTNEVRHRKRRKSIPRLRFGLRFGGGRAAIRACQVDEASKYATFRTCNIVFNGRREKS